ncbi:MAG: hypothetical protein ACI379_03180 [Nocardioides sp.]|uniref:hypothetical protein n=1 Tax=Nocardioides sp. TaxID=35761 RepID=UPI003F0F05EE
MSNRLRAAVAATAGLTLLSPLLLGAPAHAAPRKVASTVTISGYELVNDSVVFKGTVKSKKAFCKKRRVVTLRQVDDGVNAGTARTTTRGAWKVRFAQDRVNPGTFRATVKAKKVRVKGRTYLCKADTVTYEA